MITWKFLTDRDLQKQENGESCFRNKILFQAPAPVFVGEPSDSRCLIGVFGLCTHLILKYLYEFDIGGKTKGALCPQPPTPQSLCYTNLPFDKRWFQLFIYFLNYSPHSRLRSNSRWSVRDSDAREKGFKRSKSQQMNKKSNISTQLRYNATDRSNDGLVGEHFPFRWGQLWQHSVSHSGKQCGVITGKMETPE